MILIYDFDIQERRGKNFPFKNFNEREKQRNPLDFAISRLFIIVRLGDLDIVRPRPFTLFAGVSRKKERKRAVLGQ